MIDTWPGDGAEVSRKHYLTVPGHLYRPPGKTGSISGKIAKMGDSQLDRLERIVDFLSKRITCAILIFKKKKPRKVIELAGFMLYAREGSNLRPTV